jgi:hypothetical protein
MIMQNSNTSVTLKIQKVHIKIKLDNELTAEKDNICYEMCIYKEEKVRQSVQRLLRIKFKYKS